MTKKKKNKKSDMASEPVVGYSAKKETMKLAELFKTNKIVVSTSKEQELDLLRYSLSLTPKERLAYLLELNKIAYGDLSSEEMWKRFKKEIVIRKE